MSITSVGYRKPSQLDFSKYIRTEYFTIRFVWEGADTEQFYPSSGR